VCDTFQEVVHALQVLLRLAQNVLLRIIDAPGFARQHGGDGITERLNRGVQLFRGPSQQLILTALALLGGICHLLQVQGTLLQSLEQVRVDDRDGA